MIRAARLQPSQRARVWGSTRLGPWFPDPAEKIGEVWFTSDPPPPLLVKFLFTTDKLSVQVHPGGPDGKTEMWHVLAAEPSATVAAGFEKPISAKRLREAALSGEVESLLRWWKVRPGDTLFIPAGTVHAIGAGLTICEIQQYSDITYRLYDYGRPRELHLDEGLGVADLGVHSGPIRPVDDLLVRCEYFETSRAAIDGERFVAGDLIAFLKGTGEIDGQACREGEVWRLFDTVKVKGRMQALITSAP
jgi:mannose-6-phosphate isomerase